MALSDTLQTLPSNWRGLDTEGVTGDVNGGYRLCGEYGPFLTHDNSQIKILAKHGPIALPGERAVNALRRPALPVQSRNWRPACQDLPPGVGLNGPHCCCSNRPALAGGGPTRVKRIAKQHDGSQP